MTTNNEAINQTPSSSNDIYVLIIVILGIVICCGFGACCIFFVYCRGTKKELKLVKEQLKSVEMMSNDKIVRPSSDNNNDGEDHKRDEIEEMIKEMDKTQIITMNSTSTVNGEDHNFKTPNPPPRMNKVVSAESVGSVNNDEENENEEGDIDEIFSSPVSVSTPATPGKYTLETPPATTKGDVIDDNVNVNGTAAMNVDRKGTDEMYARPSTPYMETSNFE